MLVAIERVTPSDVQRLNDQFFASGSMGVTVLGNVNGLKVTREQVEL